jgi:SHS family lactate transporter-like MFS transporter
MMSPHQDAAIARKVIAACYLGWTLDAFDFFVMVFLLSDIAKAFNVTGSITTLAIVLTLGMRALGAVGFGWMADRFGRRPVLMASILSFSVLECASGFAPTLGWFLLARALFGVAMGGEWGIGASLAMESIPPRWRGLTSGLLQSGYPTGYLLAAALYWVAYPYVGWRGMFILGGVPALLVLYIRQSVPESPGWTPHRLDVFEGLLLVAKEWRKVIYAGLLMAAFNGLSHGTQDLYPSMFLSHQRHLTHEEVSKIAIVMNCGAIIGGLFFGWISQKFGRRFGIVAPCILAAFAAPVWTFAPTVLSLAAAAFVMQVCVQGAWGVVPAYLNELSPPALRATFPGFTYQLGNFLACGNVYFQSKAAERSGGDYGRVLAETAVLMALTIAVLALMGPRGTDRTRFLASAS